MSKRPIIEKKRKRVLKALRQRPEAKYDLVQHVKLRTRCTTGMAHKVLLSGALEVEGKIVGYREVEDPLHEGKKIKVLDRYLPAEYMTKIDVVKPEMFR